jgi:hypothetical protein
VARRGPSLLLLMAASAMISSHKRAWSNQDPATKARGKEHEWALRGKAGTGRAAGAGRLHVLLAPEVQALDVPKKILTGV